MAHLPHLPRERLTMTQPTHDPATRDTVRQLADQGISNRAIARQTGISEATVRRWRKADAPATHTDAPADAPPARDDAPTVELDAPTRAHLAALADTGLSDAELVALCVRFVSSAVTDAWNHAVCPRGVLPTMRIRSIHPNTPRHDPRPPRPLLHDTQTRDQLR